MTPMTKRPSRKKLRAVAASMVHLKPLPELSQTARLFCAMFDDPPHPNTQDYATIEEYLEAYHAWRILVYKKYDVNPAAPPADPL
jgi:hypothetical protein